MDVTGIAGFFSRAQHAGATLRSLCLAAWFLPHTAYALPPAHALRLVAPTELRARPARVPCLLGTAERCQHAPTWRLSGDPPARGGRALAAAPAVRIAPPPAVTPGTGRGRATKPAVTPRHALAHDISLGRGRALSLQLTPTPERCAPLVKLTF
jgi:hypothetical protein